MSTSPDLSRWQRCLCRAVAGEPITLGYLGGSITQGSLASAPEFTYAARTTAWWQRRFPQANISMINAGIGGTSSHFGAARAARDLLAHHPDGVIVDFSVNDETNDYFPQAVSSAEFFQETYEGVVRQLLAAPGAPAVLLLNNVYYDTGKSAQALHNAVGDHYALPHVSVRDTIWQQLRAGQYTREQLTPDGLHPNDFGHGLLAEELARFFAQAEAAMPAALPEASAQAPLPAPLTPNAYESARLLTSRTAPDAAALDGFCADPRPKEGLLDIFKEGWLGTAPGQRITFTVEARCIAVQYKKAVAPALRARLVLDGDEADARILDGHFPNGWGDWLFLEPVLHHGTPGPHTLALETLPAAPEAAAPDTPPEPFCLVSLIVA